MNESELTDLFRRLGATNPESWASSQIQEEIPQLARFLFLRQAWSRIVDEDDHSWQSAEIAYARENPDAPYAGVGQALGRLVAAGAAESDLTDVARGLQAQLLFALCCLLEDPADLEEEARDMAWGLFQLDENDQPVAHIGGLHESVLETDPTGREMRPRGDALSRPVRR